jgi:hypothetical protein
MRWKTRLLITLVLTRVHASICTQGSKCLVNCGEKLQLNYRAAYGVAVKKLVILHAMVQYAESMVKLDNNAVF